MYAVTFWIELAVILVSFPQILRRTIMYRTHFPTFIFIIDVSMCSPAQFLDPTQRK